ncbi:MAG: hypothetical protein PHW47_02450 [Lachnospira sp.]|nr:hypothetical protein [Lachnospira sp.]
MAEGNSIRDEIKEEKKKFKTLSFFAKIQYIWQYYKFYILAVILVVVAVGAFINSYIRTNYDKVCYIAVAEGTIANHADDQDVLSVDFTEYLGIDNKNERIDIDYSYSIVGDALDQTNTNIDINKIYTLASTSNLDGYLTERDYIDMFSNSKETFLYDLRELLTTEELDKLADQLVYFTDGDGNSIPFAVDISTAPVIKASGLQMNDPCYGIPVTTKYADNATAFIRYVFEL